MGGEEVQQTVVSEAERPAGAEVAGGQLHPPPADPGGQFYCQVPGCTERPSDDDARYYRRFRICRYHAGLSQVVIQGQALRFCQQCGRFQDITDFEGVRKSCRASLDKHNARRRRKSSFGGSAAPGSPPAAQDRPGGGRSAPYARGREQHPQHQRQHAEQHAQRQRGYSPPPAAAGPGWGDRHAADRYPPAQRGTAAAGVDGWGPPLLSYQRGELQQQYAHPQGLPPASLHDLLPPPAPEELGFLHSTQQQALLRELLGGAAAAAAPPGGDGGLPSAQALAAALEQVPGLLQMAAAAEGQGAGGLPREVMDALEQAPSLLQAASSLAHAASARSAPLGDVRSGSLPLWAAPPAGPAGPSLASAMAGPSPRQQQQQQQAAAWQVKQEPAAPCTVPPSPASAFAALAHKPFQGLSLPGPPQPGGWLKQDPEGGAAGSWLAAHVSSHGSTALPAPTLGPGGWPEQAQHAQQQCYPPSQAHNLYPLPGGYAPPGEAELPPSPVPTAPLPTPWQRWPSAEPSRLGSLEVQPGKAMSSGQQAGCAPEGDCGASQLPPALQEALHRVSVRWFNVAPEKLAPHVRTGVMNLIAADPDFADLAAPPGGSTTDFVVLGPEGRGA